MSVIEPGRPEPSAIPGVAHVTWAGQAEGLQQLSVWRQSLAPGVATPCHSHDCDEVVMCLSGSGEARMNGQTHRFGANAVLVLPRGRVHQILNIGSHPLELLAVLGSSPVSTWLEDGEMLPLPWRS